MTYSPQLSSPARAARAIALVALAFVAMAAVPSAASAATVSVDNGAWLLQAAPGEDSLRVEGIEGGGVQLAAPSFTSYPAECQPAQWVSNAIDCPLKPSGVRVEAGDGDDTVNVYSGLPATQVVDVRGGEGVDKISAYSNGGTTRIDGGAGDDELTGGTRADTLSGGPGDDKLYGMEMGDVLNGGDGADALRGDDNHAPGGDVMDGGAGPDSIDFDWSRTTGVQPYVTVTLNGQADDGRPAEGDNVTGVERIHLTYAATLVAAGDPVDFEVFNSNNGGSRLVGSPGPDRLRSYDDQDTIEAGAGDDWIEAGYRDDTIDPGPGRDTVNADAGTGSCNFLVCRVGTGNDTINARDGEADSIDCGNGTDVATVDKADTVTGCETVHLPTTGPGPDKPGPDEPGAKDVCKVPKVKAGTKQAAAVKRVRGAGCKPKVVKAASKKVKKGHVIKVSPKAGRQLKRGATVKIHVSRGRR